MKLSDFLYVLILVGSIQGVITGILLFRASLHQVSDRLLAFTVWLIALPGFHLYGHHAGFFNGTAVMDWVHALIPWVLIMPLGPLIYFYIRSLLTPSFTLYSKDALHFIPVLVDVLPKLAEILFLTGLLPAMFIVDKAALTRFIDVYNQYADLPRWLSFGYYVYAAGRLLTKAQPGGVTNPQPGVIWAQKFITAMKVLVVIWGCYLVPYLIPVSAVVLANTVGWFPVYIPMAVLIYWIGIAGYRQAMATAPVIETASSAAVTATEGGISKELLEKTAQALVRSMEQDKLFLNPDLDVSGLANATGIAGKLISATLNQHLKSNFSQFVNEYRVAEFKKQVLLPGAADLTMAGLAASCGFSSQATFQRIFKQFTGITPGEFKKTAQPVG